MNSIIYGFGGIAVGCLVIVLISISNTNSNGTDDITTECLNGVEYYTRYNKVNDIKALAPKYSPSGKVVPCTK